jgi:hypothetical protein
MSKLILILSAASGLDAVRVEVVDPGGDHLPGTQGDARNQMIPDTLGSLIRGIFIKTLSNPLATSIGSTTRVVTGVRHQR